MDIDYETHKNLIFMTPKCKQATKAIFAFYAVCFYRNTNFYISFPKTFPYLTIRIGILMAYQGKEHY